MHEVIYCTCLILASFNSFLSLSISASFSWNKKSFIFNIQYKGPVWISIIQQYNLLTPNKNQFTKLIKRERNNTGPYLVFHLLLVEENTGHPLVILISHEVGLPFPLLLICIHQNLDSFLIHLFCGLFIYSDALAKVSLWTKCQCCS